MRIAVLIACHDRKAKTLACLRSLGTFDGRVFLVDGGSTDGTPAAVESEFPSVRVIRRGSDVWWASGMRIAWSAAAAEGGWDCYLWLNDDVILDAGAINELAAAADDRTIVTGMLRQPGTDLVSYAADDLGLKKVPAQRRVEVKGYLHGNCLLVTAGAFAKIGGMAEGIVHNFGDMEYGVRARRRGMRIVAVGPVGECFRQPAFDRRRLLSMSVRERWRTLQDPKLIAAADWIRFKRLTKGRFFATLSALKMLFLVVFPKAVVR